ncbi:MAG: acyl-CoA/acyl-ACP dehydrogenase [Actinobacteria bacterium]|nr:acyl-CoA/acyl-ACP dehydrogenase [Actinomycetota bacterium]
MSEERRALHALLPGLDEQLADFPLATLEACDSPAIELFRAAGGPGLLVPTEHRGHGIDARTALLVQRALGARSPSLAVATTMHHFSTATLVEVWRREQGLEWMLLQGIAERGLLLASGFAEGTHGQAVLRPTMRGRRVAGMVRLNGSKRPCSLARSMDILTTSVAILGEDGRDELAIALVSADLPGIEVTPFWSTPLLAGAQSDAVTLRDVAVEERLVVPVGVLGASELDAVQAAGFLWFELLIAAAYLGVASALVERLLEARRGDAAVRVTAVAELESSMAALCGIARAVDDGADRAGLLGPALLCRYATQDAIVRATTLAVEHLGGMAFISSSDVGYLSAAARALAFHPPARSVAARAVDAALGGAPLQLP